jgi:Transcriptional regulatory protein, C terminal
MNRPFLFREGLRRARKPVLDLERRLPIDPADGNEERLTASEFDLLKILAENPNRPLMRDWLLEVTAHREADAFDRAIDLRIPDCVARSRPILPTPRRSAPCAGSATCSSHPKTDCWVRQALRLSVCNAILCCNRKTRQRQLWVKPRLASSDLWRAQYGSVSKPDIPYSLGKPVRHPGHASPT